jgi:hypothetical protein
LDRINRIVFAFPPLSGEKKKDVLAQSRRDAEGVLVKKTKNISDRINPGEIEPQRHFTGHSRIGRISPLRRSLRSGSPPARGCDSSEARGELTLYLLL